MPTLADAFRFVQDPATPLAPRPGRPEAAAAIWRWRAGAAAAGPGPAKLRREGATRALVGLLAGKAFQVLGFEHLAYVAWAVSALILLAALASPAGAYAAIGRGLSGLGRLVGRALAILLLTPVFFLFFFPFGRLLRGGRRDRLERWFDRAAPSYWHRREDTPRTAASYERAF